MPYVDVFAENVVILTFDDRDQAIYLTGNVFNDLMVTIKVRKKMLSRYAKYECVRSMFFAYNRDNAMPYNAMPYLNLTLKII